MKFLVYRLARSEHVSAPREGLLVFTCTEGRRAVCSVALLPCRPPWHAFSGASEVPGPCGAHMCLWGLSWGFGWMIAGFFLMTIIHLQSSQEIPGAWVRENSLPGDPHFVCFPVARGADEVISAFLGIRCFKTSMPGKDDVFGNKVTIDFF